MSKKRTKIATLVEDHHGQDLDPHYLGFFACFNRGEFFEAHEVLEHLWLPQRHGPNYSFYKGLIQLAGAFVHLQKNRLRPAASLFKLARANLLKYPRVHEHLDMVVTLHMIDKWLWELATNHFDVNPLKGNNGPTLHLLPRR